MPTAPQVQTNREGEHRFQLGPGGPTLRPGPVFANVPRSGGGQATPYDLAVQRVVGVEPIFVVSDVPRAVAHYEQLGFSTSHHDEGYAFAHRNELTIHLAGAGVDLGRVGRGSIYMHVDDADALADEWRDAGVSSSSRRTLSTASVRVRMKILTGTSSASAHRFVGRAVWPIAPLLQCLQVGDQALEVGVRGGRVYHGLHRALGVFVGSTGGTVGPLGSRLPVVELVRC